MRASFLIDAIQAQGAGFFAGVPDSLLAPFCGELLARLPIGPNHRVAANEGACAALAAGEYLATGRPACVYLQNSGLGNLVNPVCSLTHPEVYAIPMILVVGWRGQPGLPDEPQHRFQGRITLDTLRLLEIPSLVVDADLSEADFAPRFADLCAALKAGRAVAVVVKKGALTGPGLRPADNGRALSREEAIGRVAAALPGNARVVASTGKISRELFEARERLGQGHGRDFLTVGSMGHSVSIALQIALRRPERPIVCLDGDGACLMHLGALSLVGASAAPLVHIVLDNGAHESVGGMPTVSERMDLCAVARGLGYAAAFDVDGAQALSLALERALAGPRPAFIRARVALGSRADLGRPTRAPIENRNDFMHGLEADR
ncbi:MAG: phosphonopyruvate decarboxylase [Christensenellales bacterium]|jgi:phosphonopyruvate decarboxylase